jgi:DNA repair protein RecN (Recombination protein N)
MLVELNISDFAIIDRLTIGFGRGLNVFTGETGAGKSIIVGAIDLVLGDRATADLVRSGAEEASVEALFDISGDRCAKLKEKLSASGIPANDELIVKRLIHKTGRNRIYLNGSLSTAVTLTEIISPIIDVCGQSEHQSLTRADEHVEVLDAFGELLPLRDEMAAAYRAWHGLRRELDLLRKDADSAAREKELLEFQLSEMEAAGLKAGEDAELEREKARLRSSERLAGDTGRIERELYSDDRAIIERLGSMARTLKELSELDDGLKASAEGVERAVFELEEAAVFLRDYASRVEFDPNRLEEIDSRLALVQALKKKYGKTIDDVLESEAKARKRLDGINNRDSTLSSLESDMNEAYSKALELANALSDARRKAAGAFKEVVVMELKDLGMEGAVFEVVFEGEKPHDRHPQAEGLDRARPMSEKGLDRLSFYMSANPGEELKPLKRIASGGELSRIMLAMKRASSRERVPTLIFDEVDAGVGGAMSWKVGAKLKKISEASQVFCITHLPQIAAFADTHFCVSKGKSDGGRVATRVEKLAYEEKVEEISRMLGGSDTSTALEHAREILNEAAERAAGVHEEPAAKQAKKGRKS